MPLGALLDQWEVYRQFQGTLKIKDKSGIEELLPSDLK